MKQWQPGPIVANELHLLHSLEGSHVEAIHRLAIEDYISADDSRVGDLHFFEFGEGPLAITFQGHSQLLRLWNLESIKSLAATTELQSQPTGTPELDDYRVMSSSHQFKCWEWVRGRTVIECGLLEWDAGGYRKSDGLYLRLDRPVLDSSHTEILIGVQLVTTCWIDLAQTHLLAPKVTKDIRRYPIQAIDGSFTIGNPE